MRALLLAAVLALACHPRARPAPTPVVAPAPVAAAAPDAGPCPECEDGFGENCYYDKRVHPEQLRADINMPSETEDACFALESYSSCHTCYHTYQLRKDGALVEVSAEEFERAVEEMRKACGDCVGMVQSGCC
jgi:hypothetical protein